MGGRWFLMRRKKKETTNQETPQLNEQTEGWFSSFQLAFSLFDVLSGLIVKYFATRKIVVQNKRSLYFSSCGNKNSRVDK